MAVANRFTGADLYVEWVHSGGTVNLTGDQRTLSVTRNMETADVTAGADGARAYKATIKNFSASLDVMYTGTAGSATFGVLTLGAEGTLRYYPSGTASGNSKGAFPALVTNTSIEIPYDDAVTLALEFQGQGDEIWNPLVDKV